MSHKRQRDRVLKTFSLPHQVLFPAGQVTRKPKDREVCLLQGKPYPCMKDCPELETIFLSKQCAHGAGIMFALPSRLGT
jgi:hypothetical protein